MLRLTRLAIKILLIIPDVLGAMCRDFLEAVVGPSVHASLVCWSREYCLLSLDKDGGNVIEWPHVDRLNISLSIQCCCYQVANTLASNRIESNQIESHCIAPHRRRGRRVGLASMLRTLFSLPASAVRSLATVSPTGQAEKATNRYARAMARPWNAGLQRTGVVGFKLGMMSHYDGWGRRHPVTVIRVCCRMGAEHYCWVATCSSRSVMPFGASPWERASFRRWGAE